MTGQPQGAAPLPTTQLLFDDENPRIRPDGVGQEHASQEALFEMLWRDFAVNELVASIASNGYFTYEPLFVIPETQVISSSKVIVG